MPKKHIKRDKLKPLNPKLKSISQQQVFEQKQSHIERSLSQQAFSQLKSQQYKPRKAKNKKLKKSKEIQKKAPKSMLNKKPPKSANKPGRTQELWFPQQRKDYWMYFLESYLADSRLQTSWRQWKTQIFFKHQAEYIRGEIHHEQVKAYDLRQKKEWLKNRSTVDILDTAVSKLMKEYVETNFDQEVYDLLVRFKREMGVKHEKTRFIEENEQNAALMLSSIKRLKREVDRGTESSYKNNDSIFIND